MRSSAQQTFQPQPDIVRTGRGLTISGTRTTLYDVLDYLKAQYPPSRIRKKLRLSKAQLEAAFAYIEAYRSELNAEYQEISKMAEDNRQYWKTHSYYRLAPVPATQNAVAPKVVAPNVLEQTALRVKLRAWQNKLSTTV
ncbi:MAG: DUF433 domain-containing protein [Cyanobacteria bacterium J06635_11]